jgi:hypothetical protein
VQSWPISFVWSKSTGIKTEILSLRTWIALKMLQEGHKKLLVGSLRTMDNNAKMWIDTLSLKYLRHGNASTILESLFEIFEAHGIDKEQAKSRLVGLGLILDFITNKGLH